MPTNEELDKKLDRLINYLHNDPDTGQKGLIASFKDHEERFIVHEERFKTFVNKYEQDQAVKRAKMGVWGAVGGAVLMAVVWLGKAIAGFFLENFHK